MAQGIDPRLVARHAGGRSEYLSSANIIRGFGGVRIYHMATRTRGREMGTKGLFEIAAADAACVESAGVGGQLEVKGGERLHTT